MLATVNVDFNSEIKNLMSTKLINDNKEILKNHLGNLYRILSKDNEAQKQRSDLLNHSKGTRKRKIQWAIKRYEKAINLFFPVIISSPNDVAAIFNHKRFDYVVIDEASQVTLERALPILYLGNTRIISGDKQQLQPTDFFQSKLKEEYEETYSDDDASVINDTSDIQDSNSLLEYVEKKYHIEMLTYHYRSSKRELIQFSNVVFYDGQLVVANSPKDNKPGIEIVDVNGLWDGKTNIFEAKKIVEKIKSICSKPHHGSIGVITFNINQKNLIDSLIEQENDANINKELNRKKENGEDESLFVKNLENVQGDERDIIIFSLTYAKQGDGSFSQRFGPINQKAGENRINVAVSRAKNKIYIFKSIKASSIARAGQSKGRQVFHDYVEYVELFAKSNDLESKEIKSLFNRYLNTSEEKNDIEQTHRFDSPFEEDVYHEIFNKLDTKKYKIETQIQQSGYRIDLAIKELKTGNFVLAIECDGHQYHHANQMQKDNDFYRQNYLENRGWAFYRIDSWKWYRSDRNKIVQEILKKLL
ncbi:MAG: hypothetical protein LBD63_00105 [Mycoplasmataceae bacterium]|nr:hypothetical protein [Mycoplasmataceae bacterium]